MSGFGRRRCSRPAAPVRLGMCPARTRHRWCRRVGRVRVVHIRQPVEWIVGRREGMVRAGRAAPAGLAEGVAEAVVRGRLHVHAGVELVDRARVSAGVEVAARASLVAGAAHLHVPEQRLAERPQHSWVPDDGVVGSRRRGGRKNPGQGSDRPRVVVAAATYGVIAAGGSAAAGRIGATQLRPRATTSAAMAGPMRVRPTASISLTVAPRIEPHVSALG